MRTSPLLTDPLRHRLDARSPWILLAWVLANYGWTCWFGFINDDYAWVERAREIIEGNAVSSYRITIFLRPIVDLSFCTNYLFGGQSPFGYHLVNLLFECVCTELVWLLARAALADPLTSLTVGILFAVHPSHAAAVSWVCNRSEIIGAALYLGAVLLHLRRRTGWAGGLFGLAVLAKETAVSFPIMAAATDGLRRQSRRRSIPALGLYLVVLAAYLGVRATWTTISVWQFLDAQQSVAGVLAVLWHQVTAAAHALLEPLQLPEGVVPVVLLSSVSAAALWASNEGGTADAARLGCVWMLVSLLPFLGWVRFDPRYAYLPSIGLALLLASAGRGLTRRFPGQRWCKWLVGTGAALWIIASVVALQLRNEQFRRNGVMSERIINALVSAVPHPEPHTVFVIDGLGGLRLGRDPWARTPVLLFALPQALQLAYADSTLDAVFPASVAATLPGRPVVRLRWDGQSAVLQH